MSHEPYPSTMFFRYLLLLLLPLIATAIYIDGQHYEPGLLDFSKSEEEISPLLAFFPEKRDNLVRQGRVRLFNRENLYEHINGHAEYFISAGFKSLAVAEYGESPDKVCCTVDIYDMGEGANAFGALMGEISDDFSKINRGFIGYISPRMLSFSKGPYYVKISAFVDGASLDTIATLIEQLMGAIKTEIPQLNHFPGVNAVAGSLRYFREAYRGIGFLSNVFEKDYIVEGKKITLALIGGEGIQIGTIVSRLLGFLRNEEIDYKEKMLDQITYYHVMDPFEGEWLLVPGKEQIFLIYGFDGGALDEAFIKNLPVK